MEIPPIDQSQVNVDGSQPLGGIESAESPPQNDNARSLLHALHRKKEWQDARQDNERLAILVTFGCNEPCSIRVGKLDQTLTARRLAQLQKPARLDLANALARDA